MFIQSGDFVNSTDMNANSAMTFYRQEKVEYNSQLCLMNMAVHGLTGVVNSFYHDAHNLNRYCDYVMANPRFNVYKEIGNANNLNKKEIIIPPIELIDKFTGLVMPILDMKYKLQRQCSSLSESRDRLLPKLMNGEMEV